MHQLRQPGFVAQVKEVLRQSGADPQRLKLEITESLLVEDTETTISMMRSLKDHGVGFSLDDFGTGYSSLSYLKRLPLDQLKIDQSFVNDVLADTNDAATAQTILALGMCLRLNVIAEGVETADQHDFLMAQGCHAFQGYLFSRRWRWSGSRCLRANAAWLPLPPSCRSRAGWNDVRATLNQ